MNPRMHLVQLFATLSLLLPVGAVCAQDAAALQSSTPPDHAIWLDSLDLSWMSTGYGEPQACESVGGNPLTLGGIVYPHGVGTHAVSDFRVNLHGSATHFGAVVGVDDEVKNSSAAIIFEVLVDGKIVAQTDVMHGGDTPVLLSADLTGGQILDLRVLNGVDGIGADHGDWAGAEITVAAGAASMPAAETIPVDPPRFVIPPIDPRPAIHGPRVIGATPLYPFLFLIPATGAGPLTYSAKGLPAGLTLDANTGIISGALADAGRTVVHLTVSGPDGKAQRDLTILGGPHLLAQTPPMGWNSWNVWADKVDEDKVKAAADEMISTGLAGHGYQYINIDDTWEAGRDDQGRIQTNAKFPDMAALGDYIHSKGLRFGIYSSPGPQTCGGYTASYQHEQQDAQSYADWNVDYLKYDWCSYDGVVHGDHSLPALQKPYALMAACLANVKRDILFSFCQYGMGDVWTWGQQTGGNTWRTHGDIGDSWSSLHDIYEKEDGHQVYAGPGHWNDPDMLEVGYVGFGNPHRSHLTPNEQITHISLWCLVSAPLLIGCDMTRLDQFTVALLSNDEALDIDQDPLGKPAGVVAKEGDDGEVWARPLFDGTHAVGLVNGSLNTQTLTVKWSDLGVTGPQQVRDLWLHKSLGKYNGSYSVAVPSHGTVLLKIGTPGKS